MLAVPKGVLAMFTNTASVVFAQPRSTDNLSVQFTNEQDVRLRVINTCTISNGWRTWNVPSATAASGTGSSCQSILLAIGEPPSSYC